MSRQKNKKLKLVAKYLSEAEREQRQKRAEKTRPNVSHNRNVSGASDHDFSRKRQYPRDNNHSSIDEVVREATAGGVIYRIRDKKLEILLVADHFNRWTIPKGHIEEGETAQETAIREIGEEAGVHSLEPICWLGKIHFRYRRENVLVLMSTQIYLFRALGNTDDIAKEDWMSGIKWFDFDEAVKIIAYEDIAKLMLRAQTRLRSRGEI